MSTIRFFVECIGWVMVLSAGTYAALRALDWAMTFAFKRLGTYHDIIEAHRRNLRDKKREAPHA